MENGPQFIVFDLSVEEKHAARYYMPMNFDRAPGCLFRMPHAVLTMEKVDGGSGEGAERIAAYEETQCRLPEACCFARHGTGKRRCSFAMLPTCRQWACISFVPKTRTRSYAPTTISG